MGAPSLVNEDAAMSRYTLQRWFNPLAVAVAVAVVVM